jgi:hypothetical protein
LSTITIVVGQSDSSIEADFTRFIHSGVVRFSADEHLMTMLFSELEVSSEQAARLARLIQSTAADQGLHTALAQVAAQFKAAEWDRKHRIFIIDVHPGELID